MHAKHQVLFIQGGGKGVHSDWDSKLVHSLRQELGDGYQVHYPRMPHEDEPKYTSWQKALEKEIEKLPDGVILVAHSVGGTILLKALTEHAAPRKLAGIFLLSVPFVGDGGWSADELKFPTHFAARLPRGVPIHFYQGLTDETTPPSHVDLYARALPQAHVHRLKGRDHQLNNDLSETAAAISALPTVTVTP